MEWNPIDLLKMVMRIPKSDDYRSGSTDSSR